MVATRNRAARLERLLGSLRAQALPNRSFEVVVVDEASSDWTRSVLTSEADRGELTVRTIWHPRPLGPAAARNAGWRAAHAPLIAFTDDDCRSHPAWLEAGVRACSQNPGAVVQGRTEPEPGERHLLGPFSRTLRVERAGPYFQTCNIFYPRGLLERLGGFDADAFSEPVPGGEDTDLAWRAIEAGAPVAFADDALVFHAVTRLGPLGTLRLAARWSQTMQIFARHRELRGVHLTYGVFWKGSHYLLFRALVALSLPRPLRCLALWLALPYGKHLLERARIEGGGPMLAPYFVLHDLVEMAAVLRGAARYRTLVL